MCKKKRIHPIKTRCSVPYWLRMSETTTRQKIDAYNVTPAHRGVFCQFTNKSTGQETGKIHLCAACHNLKIYSACNETPKLHFSEDRRYFSGVRDLAFASIWISYSFQKIQWNKFCPKGKRHIRSSVGLTNILKARFYINSKFLPTQNQKYSDRTVANKYSDCQVSYQLKFLPMP